MHTLDSTVLDRYGVNAAYVLYQAASMLPKTIHILMQGTPENISIEEVIQAMEAIGG